MLRVEFDEIAKVSDDCLRYAVIVSRFGGRFIYCKHRLRDTWEIPGGTREPGEAILKTAERELYEETGAVAFQLYPVCAYAVVREEKSWGILCFAAVTRLGDLPESEIERIGFFDAAPERLTYPGIQPFLFEKVRRWLAESFPR